jgi:hypothetical protein
MKDGNAKAKGPQQLRPEMDIKHHLDQAMQ